MAEFTPDERARSVVTLALHHEDTTLAAATLRSDPDPAMLAAMLAGMVVACIRDAAAMREMDPAAYWAMLCERNNR